MVGWNITNDWQQQLMPAMSAQIADIANYIDNNCNDKIIYPPAKLRFNAFSLTRFNNVKAVIIGQDPYHQQRQAQGLSFSVKKGLKIPPSLRNIYKELHADLGVIPAKHGDLSNWATQGVLLLNSVLTVEQNKPNSHAKIGWEVFTDYVIKILNAKKQNLVFILWGKHAQRKIKLINSNKHMILIAPHPSPFAAYKGFFGCKHFSKTNTYLQENKLTPINWQL